MRYSRPAYYDSFHCTADKCPDTCCAGWQIVIDEESLKRYENIQGNFGKRLRNSIDWQEGSFYQYNRRCVFLNEQNLCDLYTVLGSESLCDTCRKYPRHVEEYEGLREWSLSLSCPVAAEMILSQQGIPEFITEEDDEPDELEEEFEDFDLLLFTQLEDARNAVFQVPDISRALSLAKNMQECLEKGDFFAIEELIQAYPDSTDGYDAKCTQESAEKDYESKVKLYWTIYQLERLRPEWTNVLEEMYDTLYRKGAEGYAQVKNDFEAYISACPTRKNQWDNVGLQLFVFFVYTYFCGAVYDDWIYSKMALAVHSVEFIRELFVARWKRTDKLDIKDYVEISYRYAREIEHSDQNLNELEEVFAEEISTDAGVT